MCILGHQTARILRKHVWCYFELTLIGPRGEIHAKRHLSRRIKQTTLASFNVINTSGTRFATFEPERYLFPHESYNEVV